jgi:hypothetical protein
MTLDVEAGTPQKFGTVPHGTRVVVPISGGRFEGPRLRGRILAGGVDSTLLRPDGALELDARATLETDDGALVYLTYAGIRHGRPEVIEALARGEAVDPSRYYFRVTPRFETSHPRYGFLNLLLAVAAGVRKPTGPTYTVDEIL